jgi:hypothetical protein
MEKPITPQETIKKDKKQKEVAFCSKCGGQVCPDCGKANCDCKETK